MQKFKCRNWKSNRNIWVDHRDKIIASTQKIKKSKEDTKWKVRSTIKTNSWFKWAIATKHKKKIRLIKTT